MAELARDLVSGVGSPYGDEEREALRARLESHGQEGPSGAFTHDLARNLGLDKEAQMKLAMALAFEN